MRLEGLVYDFGDRSISEHLRRISEELRKQTFISGETGASAELQPLHDLASLLNVLATEVDRRQ